MLITCPNCEASYTLADSALGEKGRSVRCVKCKEVWFAAPPAPAKAEAAAEEWQPSVDEWQPSAEEWQPTIDGPPAEQASEAESAAPSGDAAWPQPEETEMPGEPLSGEPPRIDDAPPVVPVHAGDAPAEGGATISGSGALDYAEIRRHKLARQKAQKEHGFGITAGRIAAALGGVVVALVLARENIVRLMPQTASLYALAGIDINLRGLDFADLATSYENQDGVRVLYVEGEIRNVSGAIRPVANLRFTLRNAAGTDIYSWTAVPDRNLMTPGERQRFRTRLASPPNDGRDVRVGFAPHGAAVAASR